MKLTSLWKLSFAVLLTGKAAAGVAASGTGTEKPLPAAADHELTKAQNLYPAAEEVSSGRLAQKRDDYLKTRGWVLGYSHSNPNSAYLGWGEARIAAKPDDVKFGQSRVLAFETSLIEGTGDFVRFQERKTAPETIRRFFKDVGEPAEADAAQPESWGKVIRQKVEALGEAKLDAALEKAGVDPGQFRGSGLEKKRNLLKDSVLKSIHIEALKSVAGVRTLATFEDLHDVGTLIVYSDNQRDLAKSMFTGRTVARSDPTKQPDDILKQIEAACPKGAQDLADVFGVRVMTDENGDRTVVSFGQWSPAVTRADSSFTRDAGIKAGRAHAQALADGALSDFVNSTLSLELDSSVWQDEQMDRIISPRGNEEVESLVIGESLKQVLKQHGKATLQGVMTLKEWTANHPETGHLLVGCVLMWSPSSRDAAIHGLNARRPGSPSGQPQSYDNAIRVSPDLDKARDF